MKKKNDKDEYLPYLPEVKIEHLEALRPEVCLKLIDSILQKYKPEDYPANKKAIKKEILSEIKSRINNDDPLPYYCSIVVSNFLIVAGDHHDSKVRERAFEAFKAIFGDDMEEDKEKDVENDIPFSVLPLCGLMDYRKLSQDKHTGYEPLDLLYRKAQSGLTLIIEGATGTSKSFMAKAIYAMSKRRSKKFVNLNCVGIPDTLLESELFGYEKGAFNEAFKAKKGLLEQAPDGTIFLDEIGKTSHSIQTKILKVIEEQEFYRIGGLEPIKINVRFIVSVQPKEIKKRKVIPDLLYRLGYPATIKMPSLQERMSVDCSIIIFAVLNNVLAQMEMREDLVNPSDRVSDEAYELLKNHEYQGGNYRELESILREAILSAGIKEDNDKKVLPKDLYLITAKSTSIQPSESKENFQNVRLRDIIEKADVVRASIIEAKLKEVLKSDKKIKPVFVKEGGTESQYQTWRNKVKRITGKDLRDFEK